MHDEVGMLEAGFEEPLVALELQAVGHDAAGVGKHAVRRDDDVAFEPERQATRYSETVVTTELTGRWLTVGSLTSLSNS